EVVACRRPRPAFRAGGSGAGAGEAGAYHRRGSHVCPGRETGAVRAIHRCAADRGRSRRGAHAGRTGASATGVAAAGCALRRAETAPARHRFRPDAVAARPGDDADRAGPARPRAAAGRAAGGAGPAHAGAGQPADPRRHAGPGPAVALPLRVRALARQVAAIRTQRLGADHPDTLAAAYMVAMDEVYLAQDPKAFAAAATDLQ